MPSRRSHTKSRHGCSRCKQKRVKCDEARPMCGSCEKHGVVCEFGDLSAMKKMSLSHIMSGQSTPQVATPPSSVDSSSPSQQKSEPTIPITLPPLRQMELEFNLNMRDLELLHNYILNVAPSLADVPHLRDCWRGPVVKEALRHPFLMHGLLTLSALHLALHGATEERSYREIAMRQERAIELYHPNLNNITPENCDALFLCSSLITLSAFTFPQLPGPAKDPEMIMAELIDIIVFIKGITLVLDQTWDWIVRGPVAPLLRAELMVSHVKGLTDEQEAICDNLYRLNERSNHPPSTIAINSNAIAAIASAYTMHWDTTALPFIWPHYIGDDFHSLARQRNSMSLTILAYYGVMMSCCDEKWWSAGWGKQTVWSISQIIDRDYLPAISWPMKKLGLDRGDTREKAPS